MIDLFMANLFYVIFVGLLIGMPFKLVVLVILPSYLVMKLSVFIANKNTKLIK